MNNFVKSHGLENEYIVFDSEKISFEINESNIKKLCNIHYEISSDGILLKVSSSIADFGLNICSFVYEGLSKRMQIIQ